MKREAIRHPKIYDLASRLGVCRERAIGIVTVLLDWCADITPQGNIGRWPNSSIAGICGWTGDPDEFVAALVESKWVDECAVNRLVIHDLADHAEQWWKLKLRKLGLEFVSAVPSAERSTVPSAERTAEPSASRDLTEPNLTKPNKGSFSKSKAATGGYSAAFESFWKSFPTGRRSKKPDAWVSYQGAIQALIAEHGSQDAAEAYLERRAAEYATTEQGRGKYVRGPCPWLNQQAWEDPPEAWGDVGSRTSVDRVASDEDLANWNPLDGGVPDG